MQGSTIDLSNFFRQNQTFISSFISGISEKHEILMKHSSIVGKNADPEVFLWTQIQQFVTVRIRIMDFSFTKIFKNLTWKSCIQIQIKIL